MPPISISVCVGRYTCTHGWTDRGQRSTKNKIPFGFLYTRGSRSLSSVPSFSCIFFISIILMSAARSAASAFDRIQIESGFGFSRDTKGRILESSSTSPTHAEERREGDCKLGRSILSVRSIKAHYLSQSARGESGLIHSPEYL